MASTAQHDKEVESQPGYGASLTTHMRTQRNNIAMNDWETTKVIVSALQLRNVLPYEALCLPVKNSEKVRYGTQLQMQY